MNLAGHTMLIIGGSGGIGLAFAERSVEFGNEVIVTGRRQAARSSPGTMQLSGEPREVRRSLLTEGGEGLPGRRADKLIDEDAVLTRDQGYELVGVARQPLRGRMELAGWRVSR